MNTNYSFIALMLAATLAAAVPAAAELTIIGGVEFTESERAVIARNASLRAILASDPATVRAFLDSLQTNGTGVYATPDDATGDTTDPDVKRLERASPEAAHDLLQLIKKAGAGGKGPN